MRDEPAAATHRRVNVGSAERWLSGLAGGALTVVGLRAGSLKGLLAAAAGGALVYRGVSGHCQTYALLGVSTADDHAARPEEYFERGIHVDESVRVNGWPWDLYEFWRNFDNLPRFMRHVKSVEVLDERRSKWTVDGPAGQRVSWDAEIINDEPNALIAWRSLGGATVDNAGSVRFIPGTDGRDTLVRVVIDYIPPAGALGNWVAGLFGKDPASEIREDLLEFKRVMESGKLPPT